LVDGVRDALLDLLKDNPHLRIDSSVDDPFIDRFVESKKVVKISGHLTESVF